MPYKTMETNFKGLTEKLISLPKEYEYKGTEKFAKVVSKIVGHTYKKKPQFKEVIIKSKKAELKAFGETRRNYAYTSLDFLLTQEQVGNLYNNLLKFVRSVNAKKWGEYGRMMDMADLRIHRKFTTRDGKKSEYDIEGNKTNIKGNNDELEFRVVMPKIKKKSIVDGYTFKREGTKMQQKRFDERQEIAWDAVNFGFETALHTPKKSGKEEKKELIKKYPSLIAYINKAKEGGMLKEQLREKLMSKEWSTGIIDKAMSQFWDTKKENSCISYVCIPEIRVKKERLGRLLNQVLDSGDKIELSHYKKDYYSGKIGTAYKLSLGKVDEKIKMNVYATAHRRYNSTISSILEEIIQSTGILVEDGAEVSYKEKVPAKWILPFVYTGKGIGFVAKWGTSPVWIPIKYGILGPILKLRDRVRRKVWEKEQRLLEEFKRIGLQENEKYPDSCYISINPKCMEKITKEKKEIDKEN